MAVRLSRFPSFISTSLVNTSLRVDRNAFLRSPAYLTCQIHEVHRSSASPSIKRNGRIINGNRKNGGKLYHLKKMLKQFMTSSKSLGSDVKRFVAIRKKLKASGKDWNALSLDETLHMNQVREQLKI